MTTKEYLRQIRTVDKRINNKVEQIERLKSLLERVTPVLTGMPRGGDGRDRQDIIIQQIWDLSAEIEADTDMLINMKRDVYCRIAAIPDDRYRTILEAKYLCYQTWDRIAEDMQYDDVRWVHRLHGMALLAYEKIS